MAPPRAGAHTWLRLRRQRCGGCSDAAVYDVQHVVLTKDAKGKPRTVTQSVVPLSWQTASERAELERIEQLLQSANRAQFEAQRQQNAGATA